jgi:hypothetical protein
MFREGVMTTNNIKANHTKEGPQEPKLQNALIFLNYYSTAELSELEQLCSANNLNVDHVTHNYNLHDVRPYKEMIKYIIKQKTPPIILIDNNIRLLPQCIMGSSVLGTLEEMNLAIIYTYNKNINKDYKLTITTNATFDLLTDATWQIRSIERIYREKSTERTKNKYKSDKKDNIE